MTFRLVTLMSVVLLLSLAAFGLIMSFSQDQVMEEVARTASEVGRATLRTLEIHDEGEVVAALSGQVQRVHQGEAIWHEQLPSAKQLLMIQSMNAEGFDEEEIVLGRDVIAIPDGACFNKIVRESKSEFMSVVTCDQYIDTDAGGAQELPATPGGRRLFIKMEDVRAEPDIRAGNLVLTIPRFVSPVAEDIFIEEKTVLDTQMDGEGPQEVHLAKHDELKLPISVKDYEELFDKLRGRSLSLFLGVFLVGTVLTAGVATRFTRPIRKLDAGIRRISEGDLDVEVAVQGRGEIARLGKTFNNMTRRLRENQQRNREVVRREKLSALGGLAAGVAHDVRNPLHSIGLALQQMQETCRPEEEGRAAEFDDALKLIRGEIGRLDQLVGNFLRFARTDERQRQPVDLEDLLRETASLIKKEAEWRNIRIDLDITAAVPAISADGEAIRSSLLNLVLNSFEAMPDGGTLSMALRVDGAAVVVEVADTGCGIPQEAQERIFEFAYTTREGGSGLGLAMVHQCIAENHDGRVTLESEEGVGTKVRLDLPLTPPQRENRA